MAKKKYDATKKYESPVTNDEFLAFAEPVVVTVNGQPFQLEAREFKTGSVGFSLSGKVDLIIGGKVVKFQAGVNIILVGSKPVEAKAA
jgi:hypothetical protein